jgi:uncharacterized phage protein gp47/JayE
MADLPITIPALRTVVARVQADVESEMASGTDTTGAQDVYLRGTFARAMARALAGAATEIYGFAARVLGELMPDSAIDWGVTRWARLLGVERIQPQACAATITVTFTGAGSQPLGSTLTRQSDGAEYTTDAIISRGSAGTTTGAITASEAGATSDLDVGDVLVFASPDTNVTATVTVATVVTDGADVEPIADLKTRVLARLARPPQGGTAADYEAWARAYDSTIERVWVLEETPYLGAITVYFSVTGTGPTALPSGGAATALQVELRRLAPVHSAGLVTVTAPTGRGIDLTITLTPDNAFTRQYVEEELEAYFAAWFDDMDGTGIIYEDDLRNAIRLGCKRYSSTATFTIDLLEGSPATDLTITAGYLPVLGTITW